jgi:hypothetical protein
MGVVGQAGPRIIVGRNGTQLAALQSDASPPAPGISIVGSASIPTGAEVAGGHWKFVQLTDVYVMQRATHGVYMEASPVNEIYSSGGKYDLDTNDPYPVITGLQLGGLPKVFDTGVVQTMEDSPGVPLLGAQNDLPLTVTSLKRDQKFETVLMFQPTGGPWVPVESIRWRIYFTVIKTGVFLASWKMDDGAIGPDPSGPEADLLEPLWRANTKDVTFKPVGN